MRPILPAGLTALLLAVTLPAFGQEAAVEEPVPALGAEQLEAVEDDDFRDIRGYRFPALSRTVRDMQYLAIAMQLRDYCSDNRVPDEFVRDRLARFSLMSGREETCRSLNEY